MANDQYSVSIVLKGSNQLSQPVGQAQQSLRSLNQEATKTNQAFSQLKTIGAGLFAGVTLAGVARLAEDLYQTGMEAHRAETLFRSFGAQVGDTTALLENLRKATRGVVDDTSLMEGASRLLSMGIAKNAEDVTHLTSIAATFAQAMGTDVAGALEQVSLIISNESYLRLDSLGIGSGQVRELTNQYKAAGMDSAAAFAQAFMDVADEKMPQMAAVADATVSQLQKLQTSMDNWWADFGERFATGVEGMIGLLGLLAKAMEGVWAGGEAGGNPATTVAGGSEVTNRFGETVTIPDMTVNGDLIVASGYTGNEADINAQMQAQIEAYRNGPGGRGIASNYLDLLGGRGTAAAEFEGIIRQQAERAAAYAATAAAYRTAGISGLGGQTRWFEQQVAPFGDALDRLTQQFNSAMMGGFIGGGTGANLFTPESVDRMTGIQTAMAGILASAESMNERGIMSDAEVERFRQTAAWMERTKNDAQAARDALEGMSLSDLFGQGNGGRLGEIGGGLLSTLQAQGLGGDALQSLQDAIFLSTGQETAASLQFRDEVLPMLADIYTQFGTEAAITALDAYNQGAEQAAAVGGLGTPVNLTAALGYSQGGGGAASFTAKPGDTVSALAAAAGMSTADFASKYGISNPNLLIAGQTYSGGGELTQLNRFAAADDLAAAMSDAETSAATITDEMTTAVDTLSSGLEGVFSKSYDLPINLVITAAGRDAVTELVRSIVQSNGGTTPGSSNYNSRGGSSGSIGQFAGGHKPT